MKWNEACLPNDPEAAEILNSLAATLFYREERLDPVWLGARYERRDIQRWEDLPETAKSFCRDCVKTILECDADVSRYFLRLKLADKNTVRDCAERGE